MNLNYTLSLWPLGLFAAAILCALLSKRLLRWKIVLSFLTSFLSVIGMLCSFVMGATMEELLIPFLVLLWLSLYSRESIRGEE